jgi:uncharacterized membrane protein (DUF2068 family)
MERAYAGGVSQKLARDPWVMLIGIGKMIKMVSLVVLGILALTLVHRDVAESLRHWAFDIGLNPGGKLVSAALAKAGGLDPRMLREIGVATFLYAGLFGVEGAGLLLRKRWGEWVTTFITGSFIPIEVYETVLHPHVGRALFIVANVAAVGYLVHRLRQRYRAERREQPAAA